MIQIGPEATKLDFCGPDSHLGKVQYRTWNPNKNFKSKKKKFSNRSRNNEIGLFNPCYFYFGIVKINYHTSTTVIAASTTVIAAASVAAISGKLK